MSVFAIGDLHLSFGSNKPMDRFGEKWENHTQKLKENWQEIIKENDTVVLCGDTSWAMNFNELLPDFAFINALNGRKIILKGNHDYWWSTLTKINKFIIDNGFDSISMLHNNAYQIDKITICGTRGWPFDENADISDKKILKREAGRLKLSLDAAREYNNERVVFLHYPPVYERFHCTEIMELMNEYKVTRCCYGHLHDYSVKKAVQGIYDRIDFKLISGDYLDFKPMLISD